MLALKKVTLDSISQFLATTAALMFCLSTSVFASEGLGPLLLTATIDASSRNIIADSRGIYVDGQSWASVRGGEYFSIAPYYVAGVKGKAPSPIRALSYSLNDPVPGTGAVAQGVVSDPIANHILACWNEIGTAGGGFLDIPVGTTVTSKATEVHLRVNGTPAVLQFGGKCSDHGGGNGVGTTPPQITRVSETSWTINFLQGSTGRLWTGSSRTQRDAGLYYFNGVVQVNTK